MITVELQVVVPGGRMQVIGGGCYSWEIPDALCWFWRGDGGVGFWESEARVMRRLVLGCCLWPKLSRKIEQQRWRWRLLLGGLGCERGLKSLGRWRVRVLISDQLM